MPKATSGPAPPDERALVRLKDIGVKRDGHWLIRHVDMCANQGEIITIIGPNGSGKSTTLKTLLGIITPDEGIVTRDSKLRVGYAPQMLKIDQTMPLSVRRMMMLGKKISESDVRQNLDRFQIGYLIDKPMQSLSGGETRRLLLARAMLRRPQLLILDEPGQGVDVSGQMDIYDHIQACRDETGACIILVSHDLHLVMSATDRVICMNGHVCCSGTPQTISNHPHYLKLLGIKEARNLAFYRHSHNHMHLPDGQVRHDDNTIPDD